MKKIVHVLTIFLVVLLGLGNFIMKDSYFMNLFIDEFDTTINIATKSEDKEKYIGELQKIAGENNIDLIKQVNIPKNGENGKQKVNIYIFLNKTDRFEDTFKNIDIKKNNTDINKFHSAENISLLTTNDISLIPLEKLDSIHISGDYHIKANPENIQNFLDKINESKVIDVDAVVDDSFKIIGDLGVLQVFLYLLFILIVFIALIFSLIIYNNSISKEISVVNLLGYNKASFSFRKTLHLLGICSLLSILIVMLSLYFLARPDSVKGFIFSAREIFFKVLILISSLFIVEFFMMYLKAKGMDINLWIKGYRKTYNKSLNFLKTVCIGGVLYLIIVSVFGLNDYISLRPHLETWENSKNYANIACAWPWTYVEDDEKFQKLVAPKLNSLWDNLEQEGAILFDSPNSEQEFMEQDYNYVQSQAFSGNYAFINKNYLKLNKLVDKEDKDLNTYKAKDGQRLVFVPENIEISSSDKEKIKTYHKDLVINNNNITESYLPIKQGQEIFSFDSQKRLDSPDVIDQVLIMVNGKELEPDGQLKIPSLVNGKFHPYISSKENAYKDLKGVIDKTQTEPYILYITSVYDEVFTRIQEFKTQAIIYFIGFFLSLLMLNTLLKIDYETYNYNNGQKISLLKLLGYDLFSIHKKKIMQNVIIYLISLVLPILFIFITIPLEPFGFFSPRGGWTGYKLILAVLISLIFLLICFVYEIIKLKSSEKSLVTRLKEEF
ncbi:MAG: hypothetical protein PUG84_00065 [Peptoniphilaceae bacterium]|nr:hypothetical protein [Peptoniphilaceae bacterium]